MRAVPTYFSAEMVRALPDDGNRYETVYGELLVTPAPPTSHRVAVCRLLTSLNRYLELNTAGIALTAPADISWSSDVLVQPDLFVVPLEEAWTLRWSHIRSLLLAVEVASRATSRVDRFTKRRLYQDVGIPLYWILDPGRRAVEIWKPEDTLPRVARDRISWHPSGASRPFSLRLDQLFCPRRPRTSSNESHSKRH